MLQFCSTCLNEVECIPYSCCHRPVCELCLKDGKCTDCYTSNSDERPRQQMNLAQLHAEHQRLLNVKKECTLFYEASPRRARVLSAFYKADIKALNDIIETIELFIGRYTEIPEDAIVLVPIINFVRTCDYITDYCEDRKILILNRGYVEAPIEAYQFYDKNKIPFTTDSTDMITSQYYLPFTLEDHILIDKRLQKTPVICKTRRIIDIPQEYLWQLTLNEEYTDTNDIMLVNLDNLKTITVYCRLEQPQLTRLFSLPNIKNVDIRNICDDYNVELSNSIKHITLESDFSYNIVNLIIRPESKLQTLNVRRIKIKIITSIPKIPICQFIYTHVNLDNFPIKIHRFYSTCTSIHITRRMYIKKVKCDNSIITNPMLLVHPAHTSFARFSELRIPSQINLKETYNKLNKLTIWFEDEGDVCIDPCALPVLNNLKLSNCRLYIMNDTPFVALKRLFLRRCAFTSDSKFFNAPRLRSLFIIHPKEITPLEGISSDIEVLKIIAPNDLLRSEMTNEIINYAKLKKLYLIFSRIEEVDKINGMKDRLKILYTMSSGISTISKK
jgi:hypothetical protein